MNETIHLNQPIALSIAPGQADSETALRLQRTFGPSPAENCPLTLRLDEEGLSLHAEGQILRGDFTHMLPRLKQSGLSQELLVRAAKLKGAAEPLTALDATAGLERGNSMPDISKLPELAEIVSRMQVFHGDSIHAMGQLDAPPDVILLDPMFPARQKSALVKKKLQMIQKLELPCLDERELMLAAMEAKPKKLIIKRPPKGPYLAEFKPDYSITGKAVRFDCIVSPYDKIKKLKP